jgi:adenylyltransferase/sulfurtransferase
VSIPDSIHTPFDELPSRLHEFDSADQFVVYCHKTGRSLDAWRLLRKAGFGNAYVLSGGVDAWAQRIDPTLPRY